MRKDCWILVSMKPDGGPIEAFGPYSIRRYADEWARHDRKRGLAAGVVRLTVRPRPAIKRRAQRRKEGK